MKFRVHVALKNGVHDPQGEAVNRALHGLGLGQIDDVRIGKFIDLDVAGSAADAPALVDRAAKELLANLVIERYWVEELE